MADDDAGTDGTGFGRSRTRQRRRKYTERDVLRNEAQTLRIMLNSLRERADVSDEVISLTEMDENARKRMRAAQTGGSSADEEHVDGDTDEDAAGAEGDFSIEARVRGIGEADATALHGLDDNSLQDKFTNLFGAAGTHPAARSPSIAVRAGIANLFSARPVPDDDAMRAIAQQSCTQGAALLLKECPEIHELLPDFFVASCVLRASGREPSISWWCTTLVPSYGKCVWITSMVTRLKDSGVYGADGISVKMTLSASSARHYVLGEDTTTKMGNLTVADRSDMQYFVARRIATFTGRRLPRDVLSIDAIQELRMEPFSMRVATANGALRTYNLTGRVTLVVCVPIVHPDYPELMDHVRNEYASIIGVFEVEGDEGSENGAILRAIHSNICKRVLPGVEDFTNLEAAVLAVYAQSREAYPYITLPPQSDLPYPTLAETTPASSAAAVGAAAGAAH